MKKVLSFLIVVFLLSNITFSKGFFKILKDIKNTYKSRKLFETLIKKDLNYSKWIARQGLLHDNRRMKKLIKSIFPWIKSNDVQNIIQTIENEENNICYEELINSLYEKIFTEKIKNKNKILNDLKRLKNNLSNNEIFNESFKSKTDVIKFHGNYMWFEYNNALQYSAGAIDYLISNPIDEEHRYLLKWVNFATGICYTYLQNSSKNLTPNYYKARDHFKKAYLAHSDIATIFEPLNYTYIGRTYFYENNYEKAKEYYIKAIEASKKLTGKTYPDAEASYGEVLIKLGEYEEATKRINWVIENVPFINYDYPSNKIDHYEPFPDGVCCAYYNKALLCKVSGNDDEAEYYLQKGYQATYDPYRFNGPATKEYKRYYKNQLDKFSETMPIGVFLEPKESFICLKKTEKVKAFIRIETKEIVNPEFKSLNPEIFEVVSQYVDRENHIVIAELLGKKTGNGELSFKVQIDKELIERKSKIYVYSLSFYGLNEKEMIIPPICMSKEDFIEKGLPKFKNNEAYKITIFINNNKMELLHNNFESSNSTYTILNIDNENSNIYTNLEGYKVKILPESPPTKNKTSRNFEITIPKINSGIFISLDENEDNFSNIKWYSNATYEYCKNGTEILPDNAVFKILIKNVPANISSGIYSCITDIYETKVSFIKEGNDLVSQKLVVIKENTTSLFNSDDITILEYYKDPKISIKFSEKISSVEFTPIKGAYLALDADTQLNSNALIQLEESILNLGYSVIPEQSITNEEITKDLKKCSILYINSHGIYGATDEVYSLKSLVWDKAFNIAMFDSLREMITNWTISPEIFRYNSQDYKFKVVLADACGSAYKPVNELQDVLNAEYYIGWTGITNVTFINKNFAELFFNQCSKKTVFAAFKQEKQELINRSNYQWIKDFIQTNLKINPEDEKRISLNLYKE